MANVLESGRFYFGSMLLKILCPGLHESIQQDYYQVMLYVEIKIFLFDTFTVYDVV